MIRKTGVDFRAKPGDFNEVSKTLSEVEFETRSANGDVAVWMLGNGRLSDVVISEETLDDLDEQQMAALLTQTISRAESDLRDAIATAMKRELGG